MLVGSGGGWNIKGREFLEPSLVGIGGDCGFWDLSPVGNGGDWNIKDWRYWAPSSMGSDGRVYIKYSRFEDFENHHR